MAANAQRERIEARLERGGGAIELLRAPEALFRAVGALRRALYDRGLLPKARLTVPVVSVGNLSAGGTGKTPMVAWVARELAQRGRRVGLLSRGYGARAGEGNDEAALLAELLPGVPHVQDKDRARGGHALVQQHAVDAVVLDDGFQHRRLHRELDLVLLDATRPWGLAGRRDDDAPLLPRGLLREPPCALARADAIVLTRADQARDAELSELRRAVERHAPGKPLALAAHTPARLVSLDGEREELKALHGREVDVASGIGHPAAFEATLASLGARVRERRRFSDHHAFSAADLDGLGSRWLVVSAKDAVKLRPLAFAARAVVRVLEVELELLEGAPALAALLDALPVSQAQRERAALHEGLHG